MFVGLDLLIGKDISLDVGRDEMVTNYCHKVCDVMKRRVPLPWSEVMTQNAPVVDVVDKIESDGSCKTSLALQ